MHIDQTAGRPVAMTHTEHQGADTPQKLLLVVSALP